MYHFFIAVGDIYHWTIEIRRTKNVEKGWRKNESREIVKWNTAGLGDNVLHRNSYYTDHEIVCFIACELPLSLTLCIITVASGGLVLIPSHNQYQYIQFALAKAVNCTLVRYGQRDYSIQGLLTLGCFRC